VIHLEVIRFQNDHDSNLIALKLTPDGIAKRDELVFKFAQDRKIPVVMVLSGGYQLNNAGVIADSLTNVIKKCNLFANL
jgi:acetoin utilization deacetylase AcuC-like enzyme